MQKELEAKVITLNEKISAIRVELQNTKIKKSGKNEFAGFEYFELKDFLPTINLLNQKYGINDRFTIENEYAELTLINIEDDKENYYRIPFINYETPINWKKNKITGEIEQVKSMQDIQYLGALNTYYKRYLYMNAYGITDGEIIDAMDNDKMVGKKKQPAAAETNYKQLLMDELKVQGIDVMTYAKEHGVNGKTTQEEARELLEQIKRDAAATDVEVGE